MSHRRPLLIWRGLYPVSLPWAWYCRICTATDYYFSWDRAMHGAETHWNSHWVKGRTGPILLGDVRLSP